MRNKATPGKRFFIKILFFMFKAVFGGLHITVNKIQAPIFRRKQRSVF